MIPRHLLIGVVILLTASLTMGVYLWNMRARVEETRPSSTNNKPVTAPVTGASEQVTLYVAYDDPGILRAQPFRIPLPEGRQQRAHELLQALVALYLDKASPHELSAGSEVRDVYLVDPGLAVIDINSAFANGHRSGVLVEELTVASMVQTLSANVPGLTRVRILVDGKERDTLAGHADLMNFYDVAAVGQMASELQVSQ
ncbi:MAG TPA: GerMN domain-containing protein [Terriglobales bacterium]|nr:GerMN domain-containing protein [Terriglobales bacterium]